MNPEKNLWLNVLIQAVYDYADGNGAAPWVERFKADRAWEWIASDDQELGSFCWICDSLDLDAATIRRRLKRYQERSEHRRRPGRLFAESASDSAA